MREQEGSTNPKLHRSPLRLISHNDPTKKGIHLPVALDASSSRLNGCRPWSSR